jgi:hypothetical protein
VTEEFSLTIRSALISHAADFVDKYAPWHAVYLAPLDGGVSVCASLRGNMAFFGWDPQGLISGPAGLIPSSELATACRGIKAADRQLVVEAGTCKVTTYHKAHSTSKEFPLALTGAEPPDLKEVVRRCLGYWGTTPEVSRTAGRYNQDYLIKALRTLGHDDNVTLSAFQGGPLRIQAEGLNAVILLMPCGTAPLPAVPPWLETFAAP